MSSFLPTSPARCILIHPGFFSPGLLPLGSLALYSSQRNLQSPLIIFQTTQSCDVSKHKSPALRRWALFCHSRHLVLALGSQDLRGPTACLCFFGGNPRSPRCLLMSSLQLLLAPIPFEPSGHMWRLVSPFVLLWLVATLARLLPPCPQKNFY